MRLGHRFAAAFAVALAAGLVATAGAARITISRTDLVGTWSLESRYDKTADGTPRVEPDLGEDPLGMLVFDVKGHVALQLMKRHRAAPPAPSRRPTRAAGGTRGSGYEAYFGRYTADPATHTVTDSLEGALLASDVGRTLSFHYDIVGDALTLTYVTKAADGATVTRTLVWQRMY